MPTLDPFTGGTRNIIESDALFEIGRLKTANSNIINMTGVNLAIVGTREDLQTQGGSITFPAVATAMEVVSSSTDDDGAPAGTGTQKVKIYGLDANYLEVVQEVILNGTTAVAIPTSLIRVNQIISSVVGSGGRAAGNISVQTASAGTVWRVMALDLNVDEDSHYTVPGNRKGMILGWEAECFTVTGAISTAGEIRIETTVNPIEHTLVAGIFYERDEFILNNDHSGEHIFAGGLFCPPRTDIKVSAIRIDGAGTLQIATDYTLVIWDDELLE